MIAALRTGFAASPWLRAALRYGAIVLAVLLFLLSLRLSGERAGHLVAVMKFVLAMLSFTSSDHW